MPEPILAEFSVAQAVFLGGLALMIGVLMVRSRRYFRQVSDYQAPRPDAGPPNRSVPQSPSPRAAAQTASPPRDFEKWEVAMHDLARDLSGQLDSKIRILELLIREAEKVSARLETALARSRATAEPAREIPPAPLREKVQARAAAEHGDKPSTPPTPASRPLVVAAGVASAVAAAPPIDKPRFDRIYALADAGLSPATIANQIGSQVGEVELILGIRSEGRGARG